MTKLALALVGAFLTVTTVMSLECLITKLQPFGRDYFGKLDFSNGSQWRYWPASQIPAKPTVCDDTWEICRTAIPPQTTTAAPLPCDRQYQEDGSIDLDPLTPKPNYHCTCAPDSLNPHGRYCFSDQGFCRDKYFDDGMRNGTKVCRCVRNVDDGGVFDQKSVIIRECHKTPTTTPPVVVTPIPGKCIACGKTTVKKDNGDEFVALGCYGSQYIINRQMEQDDCTYHPYDETGENKYPANREREKGTKSVCFCNKDGCNEGSQLVHAVGTLMTSLVLFFAII